MSYFDPHETLELKEIIETSLEEVSSQVLDIYRGLDDTQEIPRETLEFALEAMKYVEDCSQQESKDRFEYSAQH